MLGHNRRVLMIGAHPDDEDTELLTILVRGMGAEAAYLSLDRGEGGQNLIGPELGNALGLIRTEELLAARRLDGARQYFTRADDFGYSKTLDETWQHWQPDSILKDVVRIVRQFRPQVVVSVFSGTPRDGHGQHQAAGWAAQEAFRVAGDPARFPELAAAEGIAPWAPLKLYRSARFDTLATTLTLDGGALDPSIGQSYHQIAMRSRSLHRSQDMGQLQGPGPSMVRLALMQARTAGRDSGALFAGIDTTFAPVIGETRSRAYQRIVESLRGCPSRVADSPDAARLIARARRLLLEPFDAGRAASANRKAAPVELTDQVAHLDRLAAVAEGVLVDALADDGRLVPGQTATFTLSVWNTGRASATVGVALQSAPGWTTSLGPPPPGHASSGQESVRLVAAPGAVAATVVTVRVPADVGTAIGQQVPLVALFSLPSGAQVRWDVVWRELDQGLGEVRRPIVVAPRVDVKLEPETGVWPIDSAVTRPFQVSLVHRGRDTTAGEVRLDLPAGWPPIPPQRFEFTREDEPEVLTFIVRQPATLQPGTFEIRAVAEDRQGRPYDVGVFSVDYPHIHPRFYTRRAVATIHAAMLARPQLARVGYVRGAADRVPEALQRVGVPIVLLDADALQDADLSAYDAIVVGPRAYETEPALVANNARLLAYARNGGLVVVQYQQYAFFRGNYAPYPLEVASRPPGSDPRITVAATNTGTATATGGRQATAAPGLLGGHDRVTDETAPVHIIAPSDPAVRTPNRLGERDWSGWVQERGLYFASAWDPAYRPVLEMHDPGERPLEGGLLIAPVGKGTYVYTGLSFFRQLPAGVPGAFRLFANLLALTPPSGS